MFQKRKENSLSGPIAFDVYGNRIEYTMEVIQLTGNGSLQLGIWKSDNATAFNATLSSQQQSEQTIWSLSQMKIRVSSK